MASRGVHVGDTWEELTAGGAFPGGFSPDGATYIFPEVVSQNSRGKQLYWQIFVQLQALGPDGKCTHAVPFGRREILGQPVPDLPGFVGVVITTSRQEGGAARQGGVPTYVTAGKNAGKKNATNVATQALRDALGRYNKHRKGGVLPADPPGRAPLGAAGALPGAAPGNAAPGDAAPGGAAPGGAAPGGAADERPLPMLVKKLDETRDARLTPAVFARGVTVQRKINGVRAVARNVPGGVELYSRTRGTYEGMDNIRRQIALLLEGAGRVWLSASRGPEVAAVFAAEPGPCPVYLDGELYKHGRPLNWISGESRSASGGDELEYWVFDCFFPGAKCGSILFASEARQWFLDQLFLVAPKGVITRVIRIENFAVRAETPDHAPLALARVMELQKRFLAEGFEGAIVRKDDKPYRYGDKGYHSSNLLKIKPLLDSEFPVVGYDQGARGKDKGAVIWVCEVPAGQSLTGRAEKFNVVPKNMTYAERYKVFACLGLDVGGRTRFARDFAGRPLTVEYPELSKKTGIPTQAKALAFRTYEPAPGAGAPEDPVARLLRECPSG